MEIICHCVRQVIEAVVIVCATQVGKLVSHDNAVLQALEGSLTRERKDVEGK